jgi:hypothetical protein
LESEIWAVAGLVEQTAEEEERKGKERKGKERKGKEVAVESEYFVSRAKTLTTYYSTNVTVTGTGAGRTSGYLMLNAISVVVIVYKLK